MELKELKELWIIQEMKIDRNYQLNLELLRKVNLNEAKTRMKHLTNMTALTLTFYWCAAIFFIYFTIAHLSTFHYVLAGGLLSVWTIGISIGSMIQLNLISKIDYSEPVISLQKKLENLKLVILRYFRAAMWILPFYLAHVILWFEVIFGYDIIANADNKWLIAQVITSIAFIPLAYWLYRKLDPKNYNKSWMKTLLKSSGTKVIEAIEFIDEIEQFKKAE